MSAVTTWLNLEDITLTERSQAQENKSCMTSPIRGIKKSDLEKSKELEVPFDPDIPLLDIFPKELKA